MFWIVGMAAGVSAMALPVPRAPMPGPDFKPQLNKGGAAAVKLRLVVAPSGTAVQCAASSKNGPSANGDALCALIQAQTLFTPARDAQGNPTSGVIKIWNHWARRRWAGDKQPSWDPADLALTVNKVPEGFAERSMFELIVSADAAGTIGQCAAVDKRLARPVVDFLCREARLGPVMPATDGQGIAVPSVQQFNVRLTSGKQLEKFLRQLRDAYGR